MTPQDQNEVGAHPGRSGGGDTCGVAARRIGA